MSLAVACAAHAYDYPYLILKTSDGTTHPLAVESLTLTFVDGQLEANNTETGITIPLSELSQMYFHSDPAGITEPTAASLPSGGIEVFSTAGVLIGTFNSSEEGIKALNSGIYVIKHDGGTQKIIVQ